MAISSASRITKAASKQTFYTIRFLADRERLEDAYRAYGYFRWVDDTLDSPSRSYSERVGFLRCQESLLLKCLHGGVPSETSPEEEMLVELLQRDGEKSHGLRVYLRNMMQVMDFDARRRGRLISQAELDEYTRWLASSVTECIHYFIGHDDFSPHDGTRYLAVSAAHIAHMLRDTFDDAQIGYDNVPREVLNDNDMRVLDVCKPAYRAWVQSRVDVARRYFRAGKGYFARVENGRCRLACFAYIARFEWLLDTIEWEGYVLRPQYDDRKSIATMAQMARRTLTNVLRRHPLPPLAAEKASPQQGEAWRHNL